MNSTVIRVAQTVGITSSALIAGSLMSISLIGVPAIMEAPGPLLLHQWHAMYTRGKNNMPKIAAVSLLCHGYVTYAAYNSKVIPLRQKWPIFALGGLSTIAIIPFTFAVMHQTNQQLLRKEEASRGVSKTDDMVQAGLNDEAVRPLVDRWGIMNLVRGSLPAIGALAACWAALV
ncbi:MAG: hypothetical protein M1833_002177 [Piccolia ochrophora]|nr:MAG: hypothetical protein M1833_002177 [Piccolia ochrophora]